MRGLCRFCRCLLFPQYGDGDYVCALCQEKRQEDLDLGRFIRHEMEAPSDSGALRPADWQPVKGRIGGTGLGREICLAHLQPEPCAVCAAYKAAGL